MQGDGTEVHTVVSEANGEFNFTKIPAGSYLVIVNAKDFATFTSVEFVVADQESMSLLASLLLLRRQTQRWWCGPPSSSPLSK
jgi:Carboxypeptidase regulatory-like domain